MFIRKFKTFLLLEIALLLQVVMMNIPLFLGDVAGSEILLILLFILIFFGANSIPGIARTMGRTIRQIKDASQEVQNEIRKSGGDIKSDFNLQKMVDDSVNDIAQPFKEHARTLDQALEFEPPKPFVKPIENKEVSPTELPSEDEIAGESTQTKEK
ncbi:MAG: twin-arginine translocase TatA/TatE family subunit [Fluviicola sp.]|nr:twin-arginine translocase TatA/TatE family subunit [Fluviicola sp.]